MRKIIKEKDLMLILSSPSGALEKHQFVKNFGKEKNLVMSVSYTTRPKRKSEEDGKDYIFVKKKKFDELAIKKIFLLKVHLF